MRGAGGGVWDVAVVGAGPAGAAAALSALRARPGARVLLLDRSDFPRDKSCGDGIAPHVLDVLFRLGVTGVEAGHTPVHRLHLGYPDGGAEVGGDMARPAHVVPREVLDARIVAAARDAGAEFRRARVRGVRRGAGEQVDLVLDGGRQVAARAVVAADGAQSEVRRSLGIAPAPPRHLAVAVRGYAPVLPGLETEQRIVFDSGDWPAYAWSFPIGDGRANVGYGELLRGRTLTRAHLLARLDALLPGAATGGVRWRGHHLPLSSGRPRQPPGRVLLAGDALSLINPMTGEGIYYAVLSGALAGEAAVDAASPADPGRAYAARVRRVLAPHFRDTATATRLARVPGVVTAGLSAARRDGRIFDDLVELGLGRGRLTARTLAGIARHLAPALPTAVVGRRP